MMVLIALGIPSLRQHFFTSWRGVGAMVLGIVAGLVATYLIYPVFYH